MGEVTDRIPAFCPELRTNDIVGGILTSSSGVRSASRSDGAVERSGTGFPANLIYICTMLNQCPDRNWASKPHSMMKCGNAVLVGSVDVRTGLE